MTAAELKELKALVDALARIANALENIAEAVNQRDGYVRVKQVSE